MAYIDVREPGTKKLLFRFDPERDLVEIKNRDRITVVDLQEMKDPTPNPPQMKHLEREIKRVDTQVHPYREGHRG